MVGFNKRFEGTLAAVLGGVLLLSAGGYGSRGDAAEPKVKVDDTSFKCITEMAKVRHFYRRQPAGQPDPNRDCGERRDRQLSRGFSSATDA